MTKAHPVVGEPPQPFTIAWDHAICRRCSQVLYCSTATPWVPQEEYGWCWHYGEEGPTAVFTDYPFLADMLHDCNGEMRPW